MAEELIEAPAVARFVLFFFFRNYDSAKQRSQSLSKET